MAHEFEGFDMMYFLNLTDESIAAPGVFGATAPGIGGDVEALRTGNVERFHDPDADPLAGVMMELAPHGVWATAVPEDEGYFSIAGNGIWSEFAARPGQTQVRYLAAPPAPVPLPASALLLVGGLFGLFSVSRRAVARR